MTPSPLFLDSTMTGGKLLRELLTVFWQARMGIVKVL